MQKINLIALIAGVSTLLLIAVSVFVPWWQFTVGKPAFAQVNFSPVNLNFSILGNPITIPLIWAMNLACLLTLASGGIVLLIYSLMPTKPYAKRLLGFGYKKPLYAVILFVIELFSLSALAGVFSGFSVPLMGSGILQVPSTNDSRRRRQHQCHSSGRVRMAFLFRNCRCWIMHCSQIIPSKNLSASATYAA